MDDKESNEISASENGFTNTTVGESRSSEENEIEGGSKKAISLASSDEVVSLEMKVIRIIISVMLVVTGSINTLAAKWADEINIRGRYFDHPFFQATVMFVGEICCLVAYFVVLFIQRLRWRKRHRKVLNAMDDKKTEQAYVEADGKSDLEKSAEKVSIEDDGSLQSDVSAIPSIPRFNYLLFAVPACCDVCGTSLQYVGLTLTSASAYQMLRGAVIIFTGLFSMLCLHMKLRLFKWIGMVLVVIGLVVVGVADILYANDMQGKSRISILVGDLVIVFSQVVVATQMVVEQKLLADFECPALLAVGLEGVFGFTILAVLMIPMYHIHVSSMFSSSPEYRLEDALDAFKEIGESGELAAALCCTIASIAFFNFSGVSVTKYMNATTRMVLDSIRTVVIWIVSIPLFHSNFIPLQLLGFIFLILGMFIYNDVLIGPQLRKTRCGALIYPTPRIQEERF